MTYQQQAGPPPEASQSPPPTGGGRPRGQMFHTRNYLDAAVRADIVDRLNATLADSTVLFTHAKFAHWNVKGMAFWELHELFDELAEVLERHVDELAERITALGGQAMGTAGMAVERCRLPTMPTDAVTGEEYVDLIAERLAIHDANLYGAIEAADRAGDPDTADLLNEISRVVTQYLWFLEAHLQARSPAPASTGATPPAGQPMGTEQPPSTRPGAPGT